MTRHRSHIALHALCEAVSAERLRGDRNMTPFRRHDASFCADFIALDRVTIATCSRHAIKNRSQTLTKHTLQS